MNEWLDGRTDGWMGGPKEMEGKGKEGRKNSNNLKKQMYDARAPTS